MRQRGILIISLDFELYWGVFDRISLDKYKNNIIGSREVVPKLLEMFKSYGIHATWGVTGFLFFTTLDELKAGLPKLKPSYKNKLLSAYNHINQIGQGEKDDPYHYAPTLIELIKEYKYQEIGSHTFSHYYCLEQGQDVNTFRDDIMTAKRAASKYDLEITSLIFPRNQFNNDYLPILNEVGITAFRGNELSWLYQARNEEEESLFRRGLRFLDSYINISGHNYYLLERIDASPVNIPSSRFLRPYYPQLKILEPLKLRRILSDITQAAKNKRVYHLWWHPHNFGKYQEENLDILERIFKHYKKMERKYNMTSMNMRELATSNF